MNIGVQYYRAPFPEMEYWKEDIKNVRNAGLNTLQLWVLWGWVESAPGKFDFSDYDRLVELADKNGLQVVLSSIAEIQPMWIHREVPGSEMIDRFGDIPKSVDNLLRVAELKAMAHRAYATEVNINRQEVRIELYPKAKLDIAGIPGLVAEYKNALRFIPAEKPMMLYQDKRSKNKDCEKMMAMAKELLEKIGALAM